jgi:hypothetical protein
MQYEFEFAGFDLEFVKNRSFKTIIIQQKSLFHSGAISSTTLQLLLQKAFFLRLLQELPLVALPQLEKIAFFSPGFPFRSGLGYEYISY